MSATFAKCRRTHFYDRRNAEFRFILFAYGADTGRLPPEIKILKDVTGEAEYKNRALAGSQRL